MDVDRVIREIVSPRGSVRPVLPAASPALVSLVPDNPSRSKGQIFIIGGIIMVIIFVGIAGLLSVYSTVEEKRFQDTSIEDKLLRNFAAEVVYATGVGIRTSNATALGYVENLTLLVQDSSDVRLLYVLVYTNSSRHYSVSVLNYLKDIINLTVNVSASSPLSASSNVTAGGSVSFGFLADSFGFIDVNLSYVRAGQLLHESMVFNVTQSNSSEAFYDITLHSPDSFVRLKEVYNSTW